MAAKMTAKKSKELEIIRLFVLKAINEEQDEHADLVARLTKVIGDTKEYGDTIKVLYQIYKAKIEVLEKIHDKIQSI